MGIFREGVQQAVGPEYAEYSPMGPGSFRNTQLEGGEYTIPGWGEGGFDQSRMYGKPGGFHDPGFFSSTTSFIRDAPPGVSVADYATESAHSLTYRPTDATTNFAQQYGLPFLGVAAATRLNRIRVNRENRAAGSAAAGMSRFASKFTSRSEADVAQYANRARSTTGLLNATGDRFGRGVADGFFNTGRQFTRAGFFGNGAAATATRGGIRAGLGMAGGALGTLALPFLAAEAGLAVADQTIFKPYTDMRRGQQTLRANFSNTYFGRDQGGGVIHGTGISSQAAARVSHEIQDAGTQDMMFNGRAYQAIADYSARAGLLNDVSDVSDIPNRINDIAGQVKDTMAATNSSSVRDAVNQLARMRSMGASTRSEVDQISQFDPRSEDFVGPMRSPYGSTPYEGTYFSSSRAREAAERRRQDRAQQAADADFSEDLAQNNVQQRLAQGEITTSEAREILGRHPEASNTGEVSSDALRSREGLRSYVSEDRLARLREGTSSYLPSPSLREASEAFSGRSPGQEEGSRPETIDTTTRDVSEALKEIARQGRSVEGGSPQRGEPGNVDDAKQTQQLLEGRIERPESNSNPAGLEAAGSRSMDDAVAALEDLARQGEQAEKRRQMQEDKLDKAAGSLETIAKSREEQGGSEATRAGRERFEDVSRIGVSKAQDTIFRMQGYAAASGVSSEQLYSQVGNFGGAMSQRDGTAAYTGALDASEVYADIKSAIRTGALSDEARGRAGGAEQITKEALSGAERILQNPVQDAFTYYYMRTGEQAETFQEANELYGADLSQNPEAVRGKLATEGGAAREELYAQSGGRVEYALGTVEAQMRSALPHDQIYDSNGALRGDTTAGFLRNNMGMTDKQVTSILQALNAGRDPEVIERNQAAQAAEGEETLDNVIQQEKLVGGDTVFARGVQTVTHGFQNVQETMQGIPGNIIEGMARLDDLQAEANYYLRYGERRKETVNIAEGTEENAREVSQRIISQGSPSEEDLEEMRQITGKSTLSAEDALGTAEKIVGQRKLFDVGAYADASATETDYSTRRFYRRTGQVSDRKAVQASAQFANDILTNEYASATPQDRQRARDLRDAKTTEERRDALNNLLGSSLAEQHGYAKYLEVGNLGHKFGAMTTKTEDLKTQLEVTGSPQDYLRQSQAIAKAAGLNVQEGTLEGMKAYQMATTLGRQMTQEDRDPSEIRNSEAYQEIQRLSGADNYAEVREAVRRTMHVGMKEAGNLPAQGMEGISIEEASSGSPEVMRRLQSFVGNLRARGVKERTASYASNADLESLVRVNQTTQQIQQQSSRNGGPTESATPMSMDRQQARSLGLSSERLNSSSDKLDSSSREMKEAAKAMSESSQMTKETMEELSIELKNSRMNRRNSLYDVNSFGGMRPGG